MSERFDFAKAAPGAFQAMAGFEQYRQHIRLEESLVDLICLRASQINGCAFCLDMHWKDLRALGESEQRLYGLDAWRESPYYSERERAALAWTEAITLVANTHVPDSVYEDVRAHFNEREIADLTLIAVAINSWNRICIASRKEPGAYQPSQRQQKRAS